MSFDPYQKWFGIPPSDQPPDHYCLLGVEAFESDPEKIQAAANQRVAFLQAVSGGKHMAESQRLLNEVAQALVCLTDLEHKREYDHFLKYGGPEPEAEEIEVEPTSLETGILKTRAKKSSSGSAAKRRRRSSSSSRATSGSKTRTTGKRDKGGAQSKRATSRPSSKKRSQRNGGPWMLFLALGTIILIGLGVTLFLLTRGQNGGGHAGTNKSAGTHADPQKALVTEWVFDADQLKDGMLHSKRGPNPTLPMGVHFKANPGPGLKFDQEQYLELHTKPQSIGLSPDKFSIEAWVKMAPSPKGAGLIFSCIKIPKSQWKGVWLGYDENQLAHLGVGDGNKKPTRAMDSFVLQPEKWTHLVGTFDGSKANIYVDGEWRGEERWKGKNLQFAKNQAILIGGFLDKRDKFRFPFHGTIGQIAIYNRALTADEAKERYESTKGTYSE